MRTLPLPAELPRISALTVIERDLLPDSMFYADVVWRTWVKREPRPHHAYPDDLLPWLVKDHRILPLTAGWVTYMAALDPREMFLFVRSEVTGHLILWALRDPEGNEVGPERRWRP